MKQFKKVLCAAIAACMFVGAFGSWTEIVNAESGDFTIEKGVLIEYTGDEKKVVVPDSVTEIGIAAFTHKAKNVQEIVIPESVTLCNTGCFSLVSTLETITFLNRSIKLNYDWIEQKDSWEEGPFYIGMYLDNLAYPRYDKISKGTLTIKGYKNSSAQKLAEKLVSFPYGYKSVRFIDIETGKATTYGIKVAKELKLKRGENETLRVTLPQGMKKVSKNPCWYPSESSEGAWDNKVTVSYKSDNKKVASVSSKGKVIARKKGTANITVTVSWGKNVIINNLGDVYTYKKTFKTKVKVS